MNPIGCGRAEGEFEEEESRGWDFPGERGRGPELELRLGSDVGKERGHRLLSDAYRTYAWCRFHIPL